MTRSSAAAARGNLKVFEEIAREFARFLAEFVDEPADAIGGDERRIREFCDALRPGEPPEGQRLNGNDDPIRTR